MLLRFPNEAVPFIEAREQESLPVEERLTNGEWGTIHEWLARVGRNEDENERCRGHAAIWLSHVRVACRSTLRSAHEKHRLRLLSLPSQDLNLLKVLDSIKSSAIS